jgi:hypothetical protein
VGIEIIAYGAVPSGVAEFERLDRAVMKAGL